MLIQGHATNPFVILVLWAIFVHAMFLAFRVEQARRETTALNLTTFD